MDALQKDTTAHPSLASLDLGQSSSKADSDPAPTPAASPSASVSASASNDQGKLCIALTVNGVHKQLQVEPWTTLLDLLRDGLNMTGTKKGCDHGQCGACTVLVNGERINSCLALAVMKDGAEVTTIEGLAVGDVLHPLQDAFIEHDAFQCGYCTPGQICSAVGLLQEGHAQSRDDIRELMSGNLCRCGAYVNIHAAIEQVWSAQRARDHRR